MRKLLAIIIGRLLAFAGGLIGRGSSLPGSIALRICPDLDRRLHLPPVKVAVTGSSGKGSTSTLIAASLQQLGLKVAHNTAGSNMEAGVMTMLVRSASLGGRIQADVLVAEVDERSCKHVFPYLQPDVVVITNITRDQPPRQRHTDFIYSELRRALSGSEHLIINGDNPLLMRFTLPDSLGAGDQGAASPPSPVLSTQKITTYSMQADCGFKSPEQRFSAVDAAYCPICGSRLEYGYYLIESVGDFACPQGHFGRSADISATQLLTGPAADGSEDRLVIDGQYQVKANTRLLYNVMNVLAAYSALAVLPLGLDRQRIAQALSSQSISSKLYSSYQWQGRPVYVLNNKAENAATFNQSLLFAAQLPGPLVLVVGWMEISRRYDADDLSWLHDIAFELVAERVTAAICTGVDSTGIAVRLKYAGIAEDRITYIEDMDERVLASLEPTEGSIVAILNFDHVEPFNRLLAGGRQ